MLGRLITCLYECKTVRMFGNFPGYFGISFKGAGEVGGWQADVKNSIFGTN